MKDFVSMVSKINSFRKIFANWIPILIKLYNGEKLIRVTLRDKSDGICTKNCIIAVVNLVNKFNFSPLKFHFKEGILYYDNSPIVLDTYSSVMISASGFIKEGNLWKNNKYKVKFIDAITTGLFENFYIQQYNTEIQGDVIDIGANIGDSAIYFALKGASYVYAFEPLPAVYKIALQNIKLNNLEDKITLINAAVGSKEGTVKVPSSINIQESEGYSITNHGDVEVPLLSFNNIIKISKDPDLLKIDCEGCEADIIFSTELDFNKIFVESHQGITRIPHKKLLKRLEEQKYRCKERMKIDNHTKLFYCIKIN